MQYFHPPDFQIGDQIGWVKNVLPGPLSCGILILRCIIEQVTKNKTKQKTLSRGLLLLGVGLL